MRKIVFILLAAFSFFTLSMNVSAQTTNTENLTTTTALQLALVAREHYWNTMNGSIPSTTSSSCTHKTFTYKNTQYRYFCNELNSKKKLTSYLNEIFTLNSIDKAIKKYAFIENKGKLAQPDADSGSLLNWDKAKGKLIYKRKDVRLYEFTVPLGETKETEKRKVTYVKVKKQWQINAFDAVN